MKKKQRSRNKKGIGKVLDRKSVSKTRRPDFSKPLSFRDESIESVLQRATRIVDLKNLGPSSELALKAAGIKTLDQFMKLGWVAIMKRLVAHNPRNRHSIFAYAIIGAEKNIFWNQIAEKDKAAARALMQELKPVKRKIKN